MQYPDQPMREEVERIVRKLGFVFSYYGSNDLVEAVLVCLEDPGALTAVTKRVYPEVAKRTGAKHWKNVSRNLGTAMDAFWARGNRELLDEMAGFHLRVQPSVGEVINYIMSYLREQKRYRF